MVDSHTWESVERIVAVGDLHGDYDNYIETLKLAGLVNKRGKWIGGTTHFVQTGDIADRGPDTREIMQHIDKLATQAEKAGGHVHRLIGNHESMNAYGDLRYVTEAEFEDFTDRNSEKYRDRYFDLVMQDLKASDPEAFAELPENYREEWDASHPPGFVEHQQAWNAAWNPEGEYAVRTRELKAAVKINGVVFVHGGISDAYADRSLSELTAQAHEALADFSYEPPGILTDICGPFWYRGLTGSAMEADPGLVTTILDKLDAKRMVIGHTPTPAVIWPRFDGRVVQIDTGISKTYGGYPAYLEITPHGAYAGYPGGKVALPEHDNDRLAYLEEVLALDPDNPAVIRFRNKFMAPPAAADGAVETNEDSEQTPENAELNTCKSS